MKTCPRCNKTYTDEDLNFCLDDGASLTDSVQAAPTVMFDQQTVTRVGIPAQTLSDRNTSPVPLVSQPARSSKTWIWVVGILAIVVLACGTLSGGAFLYIGSQGGNGNHNVDPPPTASPKNGQSPTPTVTPSATVRPSAAVKTGTYQGTVTNSTYARSGDLMFRVDSIDGGNVKAFFVASHGLSGSSTLTGTLTNDGKMILSGKAEDGRSLRVIGTVSGDNVSGIYAITGGGSKPEAGTFNVNHQ